MSDRFFEPTATKMATFSLGKAAAATPRENKKSTSQPPNPPRASRADTGREWNGTNPPDRSRDLRILAWQPPHRCKSTTLSWSMPSGTTETPTTDVHGQFRPVPSRGEEEAPPKASQISGNPLRPSANKNWVHRDPPHLIEDEEGILPSQHTIPQSPHGTVRFILTPPRGQRDNSYQREPSNKGDLKLSILGSQLTTPSVDDEGWTRLSHIITPPQREQPSHSHALDASPSNWINATLYRPRLSPRGEVQQTNVELSSNGARYNGTWTYDDDNTTNRQRRKLITQFTFLSRLGTIQESRAERRRLLTTTIDHFLYEVILWSII
jgi:hypothetical protein